jgi:hypothetical protein
MKNNSFKIVATLTLHGVPKLNKREREQLAVWIEAQAATVRSTPVTISSRFTARKYNRVK